MKCDNKECNRVASYGATNKKWDFQINVCHIHLRDLTENYGQEWDVVAKIG